MTENRRAAVKKLKTLVLSPKGEVEPFRQQFEETFSTVFLPNHVEREETAYGGIPCDILIPEMSSVKRIMLYIHGGAFAGGSRASYRSFAASLAHETSCRLVLPEFRLAPTHPFPASCDDIMSVFKAIHAELDVSREYGKNATFIIAADGSGASLALSLLFRLSPEYRKDISHMILFSPWLDFSSDSELISNKRLKDDIIAGENLHRAVDLYTYAANFSNPQVSPLKAQPEDFKDFPQIYVQMGEKEILVRQVQTLQKLVEKAGGSFVLDLWPNMMFMFQMADEYLSSSHLAMEKIGKYLNPIATDETEAE